MTKRKKTDAAKVVKEPAQNRWDARLRKKPQYKSFRLHKRVKHPAPPIPGWWQLVKKTFRLMRANKRNLFSFFFVYGLLYFVFVRGLTSPVDITSVRESFSEVLARDISTLATNFTVLALMIQSTTSAAGDVQGMYQSIFLVTSSLALIWLFRQQQAGNKVAMKDAFYRGMYPIIPFILVLIVVSLQTIPASIGNYLFRTVIDNDLAINVTEQTVWLLLFLLLILLSAYMISSSIIALFVVTLPEMTPMKALKKAKKLVEFRRLSVMRKLAALLFVLLVLFVGIIFPSIFVSALLAQIMFFILTVLFVPFAVGYVFVLYRELL